jgi:hypothetical protein
MLDCQTNRLDYGELLRPPEGFALDRAVATTFSADLGTLLSIPIALVYSQTLEGDLTGTRFQLLEAIKRFSRQVRIYHQKGQILVPGKLNWLYAHLEDALIPILLNEPHAAFHPKVWIIRYAPLDEDGDPKPCYRLIVLSRNLTSDRSWDIAACLDGTPGEKEIRVNRPLLEFLRWLDARGPVPELAETLAELGCTDFQTPFPFESHSFLPMGIPDHGGGGITSQRAGRALIISPFLHEEMVRRLLARTEKGLRLFSSRHELEKLPVELLEQLDAFHLSDSIVDGENMVTAEDGAGDPMQQNLHAKLFIFQTPEGISWFLGSANATKAAVERNIEFMVGLHGVSGQLRIHQRMKELTGPEGEGGPFVPFHPSQGGKYDPAERERERQIRIFEHALLGAEISARVVLSENGNFDLHVDLDLSGVPTRADLTLTVQPFNTDSKRTAAVLQSGVRQSCEFSNISEVELSRFLHFRITSADGELQHGFLLRIVISGLPAGRLDNILRRIIDSRDKFFDYLRFLLADEVRKEDLLSTAGEEGAAAAGEAGEGAFFHMPIYEQLLLAASRSPRKLREIDDIVSYLSGDGGEEVVPAGFHSFWEIFRTFMPPEADKPKS